MDFEANYISQGSDAKFVVHALIHTLIFFFKWKSVILLQSFTKKKLHAHIFRF